MCAHHDLLLHGRIVVGAVHPCHAVAQLAHGAAISTTGVQHVATGAGICLSSAHAAAACCHTTQRCHAE